MLIDRPITYRFDNTRYSGGESKCRLRVYERPSTVVLLLTEPHDNTGASLTNQIEAACSHAASFVPTEAILRVQQSPEWRRSVAELRLLGLDLEPLPFTFVEHYPAKNGLSLRDETFDVVRFLYRPTARFGPNVIGPSELTHPEWDSMNREEFEALIGERWKPEYYP